MTTHEVWSIDRYESVKIRASTALDAVLRYISSGVRLGPLVFVARGGVVTEYEITESGVTERGNFPDWRYRH